jgi:hypothetical protein
MLSRWIQQHLQISSLRLQHLPLLAQFLAFHVRVTILLPRTRAWVSHAQWQDQAITHSLRTKVWDALDNQVLAQVDLVLQAQVVLLLGRADLVLPEQVDLLVQAALVQLVLALQVEHQASVVLAEDQALVAVVVVAVQLVLSVRAVLETHLRLESQRERNVKNLNYVQRLASVEQLFHAVMATLLFDFVAVHLFKTSQTRLMPMLVS